MNFKDFLRKKNISDADFEKMSAEDTAKLQAEFNSEVQKELNDRAEKAEQAAKEAKEAAEKAKEGMISKEDAEKMVEEKTKEVSDLKTKYEELDGIVKEQGKKLKDKAQHEFTSPFASFTEEAYKEVSENKKRGDHDEMFKFETKAFESDMVMTVNPVSSSVYPSDGTPGLNATMRTLYAKVIGFFTPKKPISKIMDLVSLEPLDAEKLIVFNENVVGSVEITPECVEKPVVSINYEEQSADAQPVAALFYTTLKLRKFFSGLVNRLRNAVEQLISEKIPAYVLAHVKANASPFTPAAGLDDFVNPGKFEAIVAINASLKMLGYNPNVVMLSPVAYAKMVTTRTPDGVYTLANGSSIILVNDTIKIGSQNLSIIEDPTLGPDDVILGDFAQAVFVGLDGNYYYFETDGRTDNHATVNTAPKTGLAVNIRTHEVAKFVAVIMPDATKSGVVSTTFTDVLELITAEEEEDDTPPAG